MKEIVVVSGKGGTGKTTITAGFAFLEKNKVMTDCDVDAADLHLLLLPEIKKKEEFISGKTAVIKNDKCFKCGQCEAVCRFGAIKNFKVDHIACEGCGFCFEICPCDAVIMQDNICGHWFYSDTKYGPMVHAALGAGEENSGRLVSVVRKKAREVAQELKREIIITDGPPGMGCAVLSSLTGADIALIVTEPTCSGLHDLERIIDVAKKFNLKIFVCINKYDINIKMSENIKERCAKKGVQVIAEIPFDKKVVEFLSAGRIIVEDESFEVSKVIKKMWQYLKDQMKEKK
ncbi:MAG: ATP-binding protein [Candidatus Omnitrophica bacterium]|nr:ATP-binding protein [Candidatus Omnitrophota bacterium]